jgi:E3 ubiquitin-protein ligase HUWE1
MAVTEENKAEYVSLVTHYMLRGRIEEQIDAFCRGFHGLIPKEEITFLEPNELDLLICGVPEVSIADLRKNCEFVRPYDAKHPVVAMLFTVLEKWDSEKLAKFLIFVTGSSQVPLGGFATLRQAGTPIRVQPGGTKERLPSAHTCMNTLDLPEYEDEEEMQGKLLIAIYECSTFGMS